MQDIRSTFTFILIALFSITYAQQTEDYFQEETGLPGDNLNLSAVLQLFKESKSIESFEKALNEEDQKVNNLDIDENGQIDYIRVEDLVENDVHAIVLQVPIAEDQSQDIAVIEIEKTGSGAAVLQIVGDEDIYGEAWIVEPFEEEDYGKGPSFDDRVRLVVNVWAWPSVRYIYRPNYVAWVSPWRYHYYPRWWKPWRPFSWRNYRSLHLHHHRHFHIASIHRVHRAHNIYVPKRKVSTTIHLKNRTKVSSYRARPNVAARASISTTKTIHRTGAAGGNVSASKTTKVGVARGQNGQKVVAKGTSKSVTAEGPNGNRVGVQKKQVHAAGRNGRNRGVTKKTQVKKGYQGQRGAQATAKSTSAKTFKSNGNQSKASKSKSKTVKAKKSDGSGVARKTSAKKTVRKRKK